MSTASLVSFDMFSCINYVAVMHLETHVPADTKLTLKSIEAIAQDVSMLHRNNFIRRLLFHINNLKENLVRVNHRSSSSEDGGLMRIEEF